MWGRTEKCLKETAEEISLSGTECHYFLCDVANREEVYKQAKVVREKVHQLNIYKDIFTCTNAEMSFAHRETLHKIFLCDASLYVYWRRAALSPIWCIDYTSSEISE